MDRDRQVKQSQEVRRSHVVEGKSPIVTAFETVINVRLSKILAPCERKYKAQESYNASCERNGLS